MHDFKGGLNANGDQLNNVSQTNRLLVTMLKFGSARPPRGQYTVGTVANVSQKKVQVGFSDVSNNKILDWGSADKAGACASGRWSTARALSLAPCLAWLVPRAPSQPSPSGPDFFPPAGEGVWRFQSPSTLALHRSPQSCTCPSSRRSRLVGRPSV